MKPEQGRRPRSCAGGCSSWTESLAGRARGKGVCSVPQAEALPGRMAPSPACHSHPEWMRSCPVELVGRRREKGSTITSSSCARVQPGYQEASDTTAATLVLPLPFVPGLWRSGSSSTSPAPDVTLPPPPNLSATLPATRALLPTPPSDNGLSCFRVSSDSHGLHGQQTPGTQSDLQVTNGFYVFKDL